MNKQRTSSHMIMAKEAFVKDQPLQSIQLSRAIASFMVMFFHAGFLPFGNIGVDFFFVLSGFIIFYATEDIFTKPQFFFPYLLKRAARIYPMYWLIIRTYLGLHFLLGNLHDFYKGDFITYLKSIFLYPKHQLIILTSWTLGYELFFYLVVAPLVLSRKWQYFILLWLFFVFIGHVYHLSYNQSLIKNAYTDFMFDNLYLEFGCGILCFYLLKRFQFEISKRTTKLLLLFVIVVLALLLLNNVKDSITVGIAFSALLFLMVYLEKKYGLFINPALILLGDVSYILYLIHTIVMSTWMGVIQKVPALSWISLQVITLSGIVLSVALSIAIHVMIEKPLLRYSRLCWCSSPTKLRTTNKWQA